MEELHFGDTQSVVERVEGHDGRQPQQDCVKQQKCQLSVKLQVSQAAGRQSSVSQAAGLSVERHDGRQPQQDFQGVSFSDTHQTLALPHLIRERERWGEAEGEGERGRERLVERASVWGLQAHRLLYHSA